MRIRGVAVLGLIAALTFAQCHADEGRTVSADGRVGTSAATLTWSAGPAPLQTHVGQTAALLGDGRVLVAGGAGIADQAEAFDPKTATFVALPSKMHAKRSYHTATMLFSGQVLLAGGDGAKTAEIFDPTKNTFTATGSMVVSRSHHAAVRLTNGRVLFAGGGGGADRSAEIFDPSSGTFSAVPDRVGGGGDGDLVLLTNATALFVGRTGDAEIFQLTGPGVWTLVPDGASGSTPDPRAVVRMANGLVLVSATQQGVNITGPTTIQIFDPSANGGLGGFGADSAAIDGAVQGMSGVFLPNGHALLAGGAYRVVDGTKVESSSAIVYDPSTSTWTADTATTSLHHDQTATMLQNGDVLVIGGDTPGTDVRPWPGGVLSAEESIPMISPRYGATAARLQDGTILVSGGGSHAPTSVFQVYTTAEIYDPVAKSFAATGSLQDTHIYAAAATLSSGEVLVAGGADPSNPLATSPGAAPLRTAEIYDPASRTFRVVGPLGRARGHHTMTRLASGQVLVLGGCTSAPCPGELFDPATETFTLIGAPLVDRQDLGAVRLPNGKVLLVGGTTAEIFDPATRTFTATAAPSTDRSGHTAHLLGNGAAFAAGTTALTNELYVVDAAHPDGAWKVTPLMPLSATVMSWGIGSTGDVIFVGGIRTTSNGAESRMVRFDELATAALPDVVYEAPVAGVFAPAVMLTTSGRTMVAGGDASGGSVLGPIRPAALLYGDGASDLARPGLDSAPASAAGGEVITVGGHGFAARGADTPLAFWSPDTGEAVVPARVASFTASTISVVAPATALHGAGFLHVVAAGVVSSSVPLEVDPAITGAACSFDAECASGFCTDGTCCDQRCSGTCQACSARRKQSGTDGTCVTIAPGTDPDGKCFAAQGQPCAGAAQCAAGLMCVTGVCCNSACSSACLSCTLPGTVGTCNAVMDCDRTCDGDHTLKKAGASDVDCSPFKCDGTMCRTTCASVDECVGTNVCTLDGVCAAAPNVMSSHETFLGCAIGPTPRSRGVAAFGVLGVLGLGGLARRRRRRRHGADR